MDSSIIGIVVIVGILATVVPIALVLRRVLGGMMRQQAETRRLLQVGLPASARVMGVQMGGMTVTTGVHRHLQLVMHVEVHPPGRPPYAAKLTALVSELQIPQLQPGATVQVRIDPANPAKLVLEAIGTPQAAAAAPIMQYGPAGASPWGPTPGVTPVQPLTMPTGAKVGLVLGIAGAVVGVVVAIAMVSVNVVGVGLSDAPDTSTVCGQAIACCQVISSGSDAADSCKNLGKIGVPEQACQSSLDGFRQAAQAQGRSCP
jgi:hypothetical protein